MKELLDRLDLIRCGLCDSVDGADLLWLIKFRGVCCHFAIDSETIDDDEGFEYALENPTGEHYRKGLIYIVDVLTDAIMTLTKAGFPDEVSLAFATAREAMKSVSPFFWVEVTSSDPSRNQRFDEIVARLHAIRPELLHAYAFVRRHVELHSGSDALEPRTPRLLTGLPTGDDAEEVLKGQQLKLFKALRSLRSNRWMSFGDIAEIDGAFRKSEPSDCAIVKALERLSDALLGTDWSVDISAESCRARLERLKSSTN